VQLVVVDSVGVDDGGGDDEDLVEVAGEGQGGGDGVGQRHLGGGDRPSWRHVAVQSVTVESEPAEVAAGFQAGAQLVEERRQLVSKDGQFAEDLVGLGCGEVPRRGLLDRGLDCVGGRLSELGKGWWAVVIGHGASVVIGSGSGCGCLLAGR